MFKKSCQQAWPEAGLSSADWTVLWGSKGAGLVPVKAQGEGGPRSPAKGSALAGKGVMGETEQHWTQVRTDLEGTPDALSSPLALKTARCTSSLRLRGPEEPAALSPSGWGPASAVGHLDRGL